MHYFDYTLMPLSTYRQCIASVYGEAEGSVDVPLLMTDMKYAHGTELVHWYKRTSMEQTGIQAYDRFV